MAMLHKWATGSHSKDNTKNDSAGNAVIQASGDFAYELPNNAPSEAAGQVGAATTPYTRAVDNTRTAKTLSSPSAGTKIFQLGNYTSAARDRVGSAGTTKKAFKHWYNLCKMWKYRKICKNRNKVGVNPDAPTTNLYEA